MLSNARASVRGHLAYFDTGDVLGLYLNADYLYLKTR